MDNLKANIMERLFSLYILTLFCSFSLLFIACSREDVDEIQGKKKKSNCTVEYIGCVEYYKQCIDNGTCDLSQYTGSTTEKAQSFCSSSFLLCVGYIMGGASAGRD